MTARSRVAEALKIRTSASARSITFRRGTPQPALYDGQGRIKPLGAAGGLPERKKNSTGGLSVGDPVGDLQGIIQGPPNAFTKAEAESRLAELRNALAEIRNNRGIQVVQGDPNDTDNSGANKALQQFNYQALYDETNALIYYFRPSDGTTPGSWQQIQIGSSVIQDEGIALPPQPAINFIGDNVVATDDPTNNRTNVTITGGGGSGGGGGITYSSDPPPNPVVTPPDDGHRWHDTTTDRTWTYQQSGNIYRPAGSKTFNGAPPSANPNAYDDGDLVIADVEVAGTVKCCFWRWRTDNSDWNKCEAGCPDDPPPNACPPGSFINPNNPIFCTT